MPMVLAVPVCLRVTPLPLVAVTAEISVKSNDPPEQSPLRMPPRSPETTVWLAVLVLKS